MPATLLARLSALRSWQRWLLLWVWLAVCAAFRPLKLPDEGRYVGVVWEMLQSGHWLLPTLDGLPYFHKPPLFYWLTLFSMHTCGSQLLCTRLAPLLGAMTMAGSLVWFLNRHLGKTPALLTLVILATQPYFYAASQFANHDMLVAGLISLCIVLLADTVLRMQAQQTYRWPLYLAYLAAALAVLAKGLIGVVLPAAVIALWLLSSQRWRLLMRLLSLPALLVFCVVAAPWFICMQQQYPGFFDYFFIHHHFQRFTGHHFNNQHGMWFYPVMLFLLTLPWSWQPGVWKPGVWNLWSCRRTVLQLFNPLQQDMLKLMLSWATVIVLFFSIPASKPLGYVLPALPAIATVLGLVIWHNEQFSRRFSLYVMLAMAACLVTVGVEDQAELHKNSFQIAHRMQRLVQANDQLVMIGKYHYDFAFTLRLKHPAWVVETWDHPEHFIHDDWKKELAEAGQFAPDAAKHTLILPAQLDSRLCAANHTQTLWVLDSGSYHQRSQVLQHTRPLLQLKHHLLWQLPMHSLAVVCTAKSG